MAHEKIGYFLIVLFAAISVTAIIARTLTGGEGEARLGVLGGTYRRTTCTGTLKVSVNPKEGGKCALQADVNMKNCEGKGWYVFNGNTCGGILVCNGNINQAESIWRCSWEAYSGTHTFTLCADSDAKATDSIVC